jgi:Asp-tRNA(Asn)/Glu-tRNA(Gln) amidotransferase B subunit
MTDWRLAFLLFPPKDLARLIELEEAGEISRAAAKQAMEIVIKERSALLLEYLRKAPLTPE